MTYRLLDVDTEWPLIESEFTARGVGLPDPRFAMIMGAFDDAETLQGFLVCQMQFHFEPLVLYSPYALRGLVHGLEKELKERIGGGRYYAFADSDKISSLMTAMGLEVSPFAVFSRQI